MSNEQTNSTSNVTWLDLGHRLLDGIDLKRELNEASTKFMTGCVDWLEQGRPLSPKQSESYVRNINIHTGSKFSLDTMVEYDGVPDEFGVLSINGNKATFTGGSMAVTDKNGVERIRVWNDGMSVNGQRLDELVKLKEAQAAQAAQIDAVQAIAAAQGTFHATSGQAVHSENAMDGMVEAVTQLMASVQVLAQAVANIKASSR